ncbi:hypothetical protein QBC34DRAFT_357576 [Podospora aff. communis PSN243]|uniref:Rhodopsin domain-containing protein n=1 Tax=Podospora aff. communis PSN243 TaxID=3040156 RepID=A0AAV9GG13_9PEZI|nr:hypothetical protein QBC34DRAFT_357576 [Podospora aff. communis PSN243]
MRVTLWILVSVSLLFLALRIYCKRLKSRSLWYDDHFLIAAWLALTADAVINTYNLTLGFGSHASTLPASSIPPITLLFHISSSLATLGAVWSKTSFGLTLLRITSTREHQTLKACVWFIIVTMNLAMSISVLVTWIQCNPVEKVWDPERVNGICWDARVGVYYGVFAAAYSGLMDVVLALLPWGVVWRLQMGRKEKVGVGIAMGMGVFAGCAAFIKSTKIPLVLDGDFTYEGYDLVIWSAAEVAITICAACVPLLRVLIREVRNITQKTGDKMITEASFSFHRKSQGVGASRRESTVVITGGPPAQDAEKDTQWKLLALNFGNFPGLGSAPGREASEEERNNMKAMEAAANSAHSNRASLGRILQTQEVTVKYHSREEAESKETMTGRGRGDDEMV